MQVLSCVCAISLAATGAAVAGERCQAPVVNWQPRNVLQMRLEDQGWKVSGIRAAEGCYEGHALNARGCKPISTRKALRPST
jgi:hypothetical protein